MKTRVLLYLEPSPTNLRFWLISPIVAPLVHECSSKTTIRPVPVASQLAVVVVRDSVLIATDMGG